MRGQPAFKLRAVCLSLSVFQSTARRVIMNRDATCLSPNKLPILTVIFLLGPLLLSHCALCRSSRVTGHCSFEHLGRHHSIGLMYFECFVYKKEKLDASDGVTDRYIYNGE